MRRLIAGHIRSVKLHVKGASDEEVKELVDSFRVPSFNFFIFHVYRITEFTANQVKIEQKTANAINLLLRLIDRSVKLIENFANDLSKEKQTRFHQFILQKFEDLKLQGLTQKKEKDELLNASFDNIIAHEMQDMPQTEEEVSEKCEKYKKRKD